MAAVAALAALVAVAVNCRCWRRESYLLLLKLHGTPPGLREAPQQPQGAKPLPAGALERLETDLKAQDTSGGLLQ